MQEMYCMSIVVATKERIDDAISENISSAS